MLLFPRYREIERLDYELAVPKIQREFLHFTATGDRR